MPFVLLFIVFSLIHAYPPWTLVLVVINLLAILESHSVEPTRVRISPVNTGLVGHVCCHKWDVNMNNFPVIKNGQLGRPQSQWRCIAGNVINGGSSSLPWLMPWLKFPSTKCKTVSCVFRSCWRLPQGQWTSLGNMCLFFILFGFLQQIQATTCIGLIFFDSFRQSK